MYENYSHLKIERRDAVLTITLDNPPTNAASIGIHRELSTIFEDVARDDASDRLDRGAVPGDGGG